MLFRSLGVAIRSYFRNKAIFFFVLFFFGTLLPSSNLFPNPTFGQSVFDKVSWCIGSIMAERFLYMPSIGFAGCVVIAIYAAVRRIGFGTNTGESPCGKEPFNTFAHRLRRIRTASAEWNLI